MALGKEFNLNLVMILWVFFCVFLPGWLIGFGKSHNVKQTI